VIARASPLSGEAVALIAERDALYHSLYPPEEAHAQSGAALAAEDARFLIARRADSALGCGAFVHRPGYAEIKSLFVRAAARGQGIGAALLARLEADARAEGVALMRLETGTRNPEAIRLYARFGYRRRPAFGAYGDLATSVYMERRLGPAP